MNTMHLFDYRFLFLYRNTSKSSETKASIAFSKEESASINSSTLKRSVFTLYYFAHVSE